MVEMKLLRVEMSQMCEHEDVCDGERGSERFCSEIGVPCGESVIHTDISGKNSNLILRNPEKLEISIQHKKYHIGKRARTN